MKTEKVVKVDADCIEFENGLILSSEHEQDCCEHHYLSFADLTLGDFDGLEFDLSGDDFFKEIDDYGIALLPVNGLPVRVPGYGSNNGYYSSNLTLVLSGQNIRKTYNISNCQVITD